MLAGYNASFAATWGRKVRDTINEWGPAIFDGLHVRTDSAAAGEWQLAGHEGGMKTDGAGGGFTGRGANVLITDDPVKNAEEALSVTVRQSHKDWYDSTVDSRLEPDAIELLIMTRWHADDLGGHVLQHWKSCGEPWEILKLPGIAKADDVLGRKPGEALWPERFPAEYFLRKKVRTPFWYSSLYDQEPTPEGGAIFHADWFRRFKMFEDNDGVPEGVRYTDTGQVVLFSHCVTFIIVDPALGKKRTGDDVAIGVFAITPSGDLLVLHILARLLPVEQIVAELRSVVNAWPAAQFIGMEANGFQVTVATAARKALSPKIVREIDPKSTSKITRAVPAIELASGGRIRIPADGEAEWVGKYLTELCQWTAQDGDRDNQVDVTAYAGLEVVGRYAGNPADEGMVVTKRYGT